MKRRSHSWCFSAVLVCAALSPLALGATTITVRGGHAGDPNTIQEAVDLAAAGDVIVLGPGTYTGPGNCDIDLKGKVVTIRGADPCDPNIVQGTVIDCAGSVEEPHRAFYLADCNGVVLSGLTITRGLATAGGAVFCQRSTLTLSHCRILDNAALSGNETDLNGGPGGGLYAEASTVQVLECLIRGNTAGDGAFSKDGKAGVGGNGGGLCGVKSTLDVISCTITRNAAGAGADAANAPAGNGGDGGGLCSDSVRIVDSSISSNQAGAGGQSAQAGRGGRGGGLYADTATIDRCLLEANRAGDEGAATADANDIQGGGAGDGGGVFGNLLTITNSLVVGNRAGQGHVADPSGWIDQGNGGGIWCVSGEIRQCTVAGNWVRRTLLADGTAAVGGQGAGIFCTPETALSGSLVYDNMPGQLAGQDCNNIAYCNIDTAQCAAGLDGAFLDPLFVRRGGWFNAADPSLAAEPTDPNAVWVSGNYRLQKTSPMLDAGDPNYIPLAGEKDLDGNARVADLAIDVGAYESQARVLVYRFWSPVAGQHFYTASAAERDKIVASYPETWVLEGPKFYAYSRPCEPNLLPVYRFVSSQSGDHFYTINEKEKNKLVSQYADAWTFECIAFYAYPAGGQPADTKPVYRFWSAAFASHFYTIKEGEKNKLIEQHPDVWTYEGVAWYAYGLPGTTTPATPAASKAVVYELSGGAAEAVCTLSLKAYLDGEPVQIDNPDLTYRADQGHLKMALDLEAMTTTLEEIQVESTPLEHTATILDADANSAPIPIVLSTSVLFSDTTAKGPLAIDPNALMFPKTGGDAPAGQNASFSIRGTITVNDAKLDVATVQPATHFATGDPGTFDMSALPGQLSARLAGTFQWSCEKQEDLLLKTTIKDRVLEIYVTSARIQTAGVWQGKLSQ